MIVYLSEQNSIKLNQLNQELDFRIKIFVSSEIQEKTVIAALLTNMKTLNLCSNGNLSNFGSTVSLKLINESFVDDHVYFLANGVTVDSVDFFLESAFLESFSALNILTDTIIKFRNQFTKTF
jgi:hypothetical protein